MYCRVGDFHWSLALDRYCPNHGTHDRAGNLRGQEYVMCDEGGPYDHKTGAHYLDCCSTPDEEDV